MAIEKGDDVLAEINSPVYSKFRPSSPNKDRFNQNNSNEAGLRIVQAQSVEKESCEMSDFSSPMK